MTVISKKNVGSVRYSQSPLKLPNGETVLFKIVGYEKLEGVSDEEMAGLMKEVEDKINSAILEIEDTRALSPQHPHFYIDCS